MLCPKRKHPALTERFVFPGCWVRASCDISDELGATNLSAAAREIWRGIAYLCAKHWSVVGPKVDCEHS